MECAAGRCGEAGHDGDDKGAGGHCGGGGVTDRQHGHPPGSVMKIHSQVNPRVCGQCGHHPLADAREAAGLVEGLPLRLPPESPVAEEAADPRQQQRVDRVRAADTAAGRVVVAAATLGAGRGGRGNGAVGWVRLGRREAARVAAIGEVDAKRGIQVVRGCRTRHTTAGLQGSRRCRVGSSSGYGASTGTRHTRTMSTAKQSRTAARVRGTRTECQKARKEEGK